VGGEGKHSSTVFFFGRSRAAYRGFHMTKTKQPEPALYNGKPLEIYDRWREMPGGFAMPHPELRGKAGLYRATLHGEIMFIGKGAGMRTGLLERLYDLRRPGDSGRRYRAGQYINSHLDELGLQVAVIGSDRAARALTSKLLRPMIQLHQPRLNVDPTFVSNTIQANYEAR
jgi:hypothetical protein